MQVLVVDDEKSIRESTIVALEADDHYAESADSGRVALLRLAEEDFDFVLLDIWKELYEPCFEAFYPGLAEEGVILSDNMIDPQHDRPAVRLYRAAVRSKPDLQTVLLPIGQGIELSVRWSAGNSKL